MVPDSLRRPCRRTAAPCAEVDALARFRDGLEECYDCSEEPLIRATGASGTQTPHLKLINDSRFRDYAHITRFCSLTRACIAQIMKLNLLASRIQEDILFLPKIHRGYDPVTERDIRSIAAIPRWSEQILIWETCNPNGL
jgi:hypothetical protein